MWNRRNLSRTEHQTQPTQVKGIAGRLGARPSRIPCDAIREEVIQAFAKETPVRKGKVITSASPPSPEVQSWKESAEHVLRNRAFILHADPLEVVIRQHWYFWERGLRVVAHVFGAGVHFANAGMKGASATRACLGGRMLRAALGCAVAVRDLLPSRLVVWSSLA